MDICFELSQHISVVRVNCQMNFNSVNVEKYAYISVSIHFLLLPQTLSTTISLQIAMLIMLLLKKVRKREKEKKEEEMHIVTLRRL